MSNSVFALTGMDQKVHLPAGRPLAFARGSRGDVGIDGEGVFVIRPMHKNGGCVRSGRSMVCSVRPTWYHCTGRPMP